MRLSHKRGRGLWLRLMGALAVTAVGTLPAQGAAPAPSERPNFVVILADDLGYGDISCYGGWIETPRIDRLAAEGIRLTDFHANGPVCSPTRAALLTGRYQQRAGIEGVINADPKTKVHGIGLDPKTQVTFAGLLQQAGYATACIGKWHLGYQERFHPLRHGFDRFVGYVSGNIDYHSHFDRMETHDWQHDGRNVEEKGYSTHLITRHALEFIDNNRQRPFCLYVPYEAPHDPYQGPDDPPVRGPGKRDPLPRKQIPRAYRQMVQEMDKGVGEIVDRLKQLNIDSNTLVFFCSDNGANAKGSNKPLRGAKGSLWEGGHRVPAVARLPGRIPPGKTNNSLAATMDLMPTMLTLAGVDLPASLRLDGMDLSPVLFGNPPRAERALYFRYGRQSAMRLGHWSLVRGDGKSQLFDLDADPGQSVDVAEKHPQQFDKMTAALKAWTIEVCDGRGAAASDSQESSDE